MGQQRKMEEVRTSQIALERQNEMLQV